MSIRLFVLGVLFRGETHGYRIKEFARTTRLDKWADVQFGSIYHALGALERERLVEQVSTERVGDRPPRSTYRLTDAGRVKFLEMLRGTCRYGFVDKHPINLGLSFLTALPPEERVVLMRERLGNIEQRLAVVQARQRELEHLRPSAPWVLATLEQDAAHCRTELEWTEGLIESVKDWPEDGEIAQ